MLTGMMQVNRSEKYEQMHEMLNEKQWRHSLALEAQERGSVAQVAQEAKVSQNTIRRGLREGSRSGRSLYLWRQAERRGRRTEKGSGEGCYVAR
jgi:hypothetical protein